MAVLKDNVYGHGLELMAELVHAYGMCECQKSFGSEKYCLFF